MLHMGTTEEQLESVVKVLLPIGYAKFRLKRGAAQPRLVEGIELVNLQNQWAMSQYRNVNNKDYDVEIAIGVARIVGQGSRISEVTKWLEAVRSELLHGEHKPHSSRYKGGNLSYCLETGGNSRVS